MKRFFNRAQRAALYIAADGKCQIAESAKKLWLEELPASGKHGGDRSKSGDRTCNEHHMNADGLLARLKRDRPDLAQQVLDGDLSATRAAQIAGFRTPTVRLGKPATVAVKLRDHYSREDLAELARLICE